MKKLLTIAFVAVVVSSVAFAQEDSTFKVSGEAKTGIYWKEEQNAGDEAKREVKIHSTDDAGGNQGRFRLNMDYERDDGFGMRARFQFHDWRNDPGYFISYGFGYGNFFERQLTVSVGRLGGSSWGTGGPEMWKELEESTIGMRVEYKPAFIPEKFGRLNIGFVLSDFNSDQDQGTSNFAEKVTIGEILKETVLGFSYTHDWGLIRMSYRFDSELDAIQENKTGSDAGKGEDEIVYRVEERVLTNYLPGFQIWALGHLFGLSAVDDNIRWYRNWLFVQYEPPELGVLELPFTAQFRVGYNAITSRSELFVKPSFYWNFFRKLISVGASFTFAQDFGENRIEGEHPFTYIELEPKLQFNFQSSYIAFVYNWRKEYFHASLQEKPGFDPIKQTQYMNLRFCIYY